MNENQPVQKVCCNLIDVAAEAIKNDILIILISFDKHEIAIKNRKKVILFYSNEMKT